MKKIILFLFLLVSTSMFSQVKDSIFLKSGKVMVVEQIMPFEFTPKVSPSDYYKPQVNTQQLFIPNDAYYDGVFFYKQLGDTVTIHTFKTNEISRLYIRMQDSKYLNEYNFYKLNKPFKSTEDYKIEYIKYNLDKYYKQVRTGQCVILSGAALTCIGAILTSTTNDKSYSRSGDDASPGLVLMVAGGAMSLVGVVIELDSYKWIKRASLKTNLNGVSLNLNF